jgi:hypothetical protein
MRRIIAPLVALGTMLWVVACGHPDPVANNVAAVNLPAPANDSAPDPLGGLPTNDISTQVGAANVAAAAADGAIPAALQGRWGLTPADCTSRRGDAKGLLVVTSGDLRFYESRAVPAPTAEADGDSINGNFSFTGEGQTWTKFETLQRKNNTLVRTDSNPAASYTYAKC